MSTESPTRLIVAIDGPSGAGKSATGRRVAQALGYLYIDTGAMYRAVGLKAARRRIDPTDADALADMVADTRIALVQNGVGVRTLLDGEDVSDAIRSPEAGRWASDISTVPAVRERLVAWQRELGREGGIVMEGRDIGTVVFPDAQVKVFLTASLAERAHRRWGDLGRRRGDDAITADEVQEEMRRRDTQDTTRAHSPLVPAPDAVEIDSTKLTEDEVRDRIVRLVHDACGP